MGNNISEILENMKKDMGINSETETSTAKETIETETGIRQTIEGLSSKLNKDKNEILREYRAEKQKIESEYKEEKARIEIEKLVQKTKTKLDNLKATFESEGQSELDKFQKSLDEIEDVKKRDRERIEKYSTETERLHAETMKMNTEIKNQLITNNILQTLAISKDNIDSLLYVVQKQIENKNDDVIDFIEQLSYNFKREDRLKVKNLIVNYRESKPQNQLELAKGSFRYTVAQELYNHLEFKENSYFTGKQEETLYFK